MWWFLSPLSPQFYDNADYQPCCVRVCLQRYLDKARRRARRVLISKEKEAKDKSQLWSIYLFNIEGKRTREMSMSSSLTFRSVLNNFFWESFIFFHILSSVTNLVKAYLEDLFHHSQLHNIMAARRSRHYGRLYNLNPGLHNGRGGFH